MFGGAIPYTIYTKSRRWSRAPHSFSDPGITSGSLELIIFSAHVRHPVILCLMMGLVPQEVKTFFWSFDIYG